MHNKPKKEMTNKERRDAGLAYISDGSIFEGQLVCRKILQRLNFMDRSNFAGISEVVKELFGKSEGAFVNPPFYCDYGKHIEVGKNFLQTITVHCWMWQKLKLVIIVNWRLM